MTLKEAAKILLEYGDGVYEHPNSAYGSESGTGVLECECCHNLLNVYPNKHKKSCRLEMARKLIEKE
jgi:hypothetical protein